MFRNSKKITLGFSDRIYYCPVELAMDIIGGKWKAVILWYLANGTLRFHELKKEITTISERVLTRELRQLEKHHLIRRQVYPEVPPRVEYTLTDFGKGIIPLLNHISRFGEDYAARFSKAEHS